MNKPEFIAHIGPNTVLNVTVVSRKKGENMSIKIRDFFLKHNGDGRWINGCYLLIISFLKWRNGFKVIS